MSGPAIDNEVKLFSLFDAPARYAEIADREAMVRAGNEAAFHPSFKRGNAAASCEGDDKDAE